MAMRFSMRARNAADTADVTWVATCFPDPTGEQAPEAISTGTAIVEGHWGDRGVAFYGMRARNAANSAFVGWLSNELDTAGNDAPGGPSAISAGTAVNEGEYTSGVEYTPPERDEYLTGATSANTIVWPLTYDEEDSAGLHHLTRLGNGPHITPAGMRCNGYDAVYSLASGMPGWQNAAAQSVSLHVVAKTGTENNVSSGSPGPKVIAGLTTTTVASPKIDLVATSDIVLTSQAQLAVRDTATTTETLRLNRPQWRFEFRYPELIGGNVPSAQALMFLDASTLLISCHIGDTETPVYRVDLATGEYTGKAVSTVYRHIGSFHYRGNGEIWATDNYSGGAGYSAFEIDLDRSFLCGEVETRQTWDTSALEANAGIDFITVGGTEYVLLQQYSESGTPYLYVFPTTAMAAPATVAGRFKRFALGLRCQDIRVRASDGLLYVSRNARTGDGTATGWLQSYDVATAIASASDGATLTAVASYPHAGEYAEGLDFHPVTDRAYSSTEGLSAVADELAWVAVWSCSIPQAPEETAYLVDYDASTDHLEVRLNGRLMWSKTRDLTVAPTQVSIGGNITSATYGGPANSETVVRAVAIKDGPFTAQELDDLLAGDVYETRTLAAYAVSLTNPGAESGTTGWTAESAAGSSLDVRTTNPAPYAGSQYFTGAYVSNTAQVSRQRFSGGVATATGYSSNEVDEQTAAREMWLSAEWQQASFDAANDSGGVGLRSLTAADATISTTIPTSTSAGGARLVITPALTWHKRAEALALDDGGRGFDVLQSRLRTAGAGIDCYLDEIQATVYALERDTGTAVVSSITSLNDTSSANADLSAAGSNPLSVRGPMGTDYARLFGTTRGYLSASNQGPRAAFVGASWTWEAMVYVSAYPASGNAVMLIVGGTGTDTTLANNTVFRVSVLPAGTVRVFWEHSTAVVGTDFSFDTTGQVPIGRWCLLRVRGVTNGANRDASVHLALPGETPITIGSGSGVLATGGTTFRTEISPQGGFSGAAPFFGKLAYMRVSTTDRGTSDLATCASNPASNITNDGNTAAFYSMQERA